MTLILAIGRVADFFGEGVDGVLQSAHHRRVNPDVQGFQTIQIASGIGQSIDGFRVGAIGCKKTNNGAIGVGHDLHGIVRIIE